MSRRAYTPVDVLCRAGALTWTRANELWAVPFALHLCACGVHSYAVELIRAYVLARGVAPYVCSLAGSGPAVSRRYLILSTYGLRSGVKLI